MSERLLFRVDHHGRTFIDADPTPKRIRDTLSAAFARGFAVQIEKLRRRSRDVSA